MKEISHKQPIIGRDCQRDGNFIPKIVHEIPLEDGFSAIFIAEKCRGCCGETQPNLKMGWHEADCQDQSSTTTLIERTIVVGKNAPEGFVGQETTESICITCNDCNMSKLKGTSNVS